METWTQNNDNFVGMPTEGCGVSNGAGGGAEVE